MPGGKKGRGYESPTDDRDWFIRENAVALVRAKEEQIARLRERVTKMEKTIKELRRVIKANVPRDPPRKHGLEREIALYEQNKERWLSIGFEGQFIVIKGSVVLGLFADFYVALAAGYECWGLKQFMVKEIVRVERVYRV